MNTLNRLRENTQKKIPFLLSGLLLSACIGHANQADSDLTLAALLGALGGGSNERTAFENALLTAGQLPADVTPVAVAQEIEGSAAIPAKGVIATRSAVFRKNADIEADVAVVGTCQGEVGAAGCLAGRELTLRKHVTAGAQFTLRADSVKARKGANIAGTVVANEIDLHRKATLAHRETPLGDVPILPPFYRGTPGATEVGAADEPLAPGNYGLLKLKKKQSLELAGGFYHFSEIILRKRSALSCASTCVVLSEGRLRAGRNVNIAASSGNSSDFIFYINASNSARHESGDMDFGDPSGEGEPLAGNARDKRKAAKIGKHSNVIADIYAPNGTLAVRRDTQIRGNLIARWFIGGRNTTIVEGVATDVVSRVISAENGGSVAIADEIELVVPAGALSEDTLITITPVDDPVTPRFPAGVSFSGNQYDMKPDGLRFAAPVNLTLHFDESDFADVMEDQLAIFSSSEGHFFNLEGGTVDTILDTVSAQIYHFTIFAVGSINTSSWAINHVINGNIVYVAVGSRMEILDISDPSAPVLLSSTLFNSGFISTIWDVAVKGNYAYLAAGEYIHIVDVSNPAAPIVVGDIPTLNAGTAVRSLELSGNFLYAGGWLFQIFDISNPIAPVRVSQLSGPYGEFVRDGNLVYTVGDTYNISTGDWDGEFSVIDVSNPAAPYVVGSLDICPLSESVAVNGNRAYVGCGRNPGIEIVDFSNPATPAQIGQIGSGFFSGLFIEGTRLYAAATTNGLEVYDLSNPAAPVLVDSHNLASGGVVLEVTVSGNLAYVSARDGFHILDISGVPQPPPTTTPLGGVITVPTGVNALNPDIAVDPSGTPYIAAIHQDANQRNMYVHSWDGSQWNVIGGSLNDAVYRSSETPSIAFNGSTPYVAFTEGLSTGNKLMVKYFNGTNWVQLGGAVNNAGAQAAIDATIEFDGATPYVLIHEKHTAPTSRPFVKYYDGANWVQLGGPLNVDIDKHTVKPRMTLIGSTPYVTFVENDGSGITGQAYVVRWNGANWAQVGGVPSGGGADGPDIIDNGGQPMVVYRESPNVYVKQWDGANWNLVGARVNAEVAGSVAPRLTLLGATPYVLWEEATPADGPGVTGLFAGRYNAGAWEKIGGKLNQSPAPQPAQQGSLAASGSAVYFSFIDGYTAQLRAGKTQ